jgi:hypothetical protein
LIPAAFPVGSNGAAHRAKIIAPRLLRKQEKEIDFVLKTEHVPKCLLK